MESLSNVEVNDLITSLSTTRSSGSYHYLGQYNGHSYFRTNWIQEWNNQAISQANQDGAYLVVINDQDEMAFLKTSLNTDGCLRWILPR